MIERLMPNIFFLPASSTSAGKTVAIALCHWRTAACQVTWYCNAMMVHCKPESVDI